MPDPAIAALVPVYNRPKVVLEALESIAAQQTPPALLVVVDDGSDDNTASSVEGWLAGRTLGFEARLVCQEHGGAPSALNRGAQEAAGCDFLAILDSDDLWPADYLQHMGAALAGTSDVVAATADKEVVEYPSNTRRLAGREGIGERATEWLIRHGSAGPSNSLFQAEAFGAIGGFNPEIRTGYDYNMMLRLSLKGRWLYVPGPVVTYRHNYAQSVGEVPPLSHSYSDRRLRRARNMARFIDEEGGRAAVQASVWKPRLGRLWFQAGRQMLQQDHRSEARDCFRKALRLSPWRWRAWWGLLRARGADGT